MKIALAFGAALAALTLLSAPATAAPGGVSAGLSSFADVQTAAPKKKSVTKKAAKAKKVRRAAGRK